MRLSLFSPLLVSLFFSSVSANVGLESGQDLLSFVTRPDLKPPKWDIKYYNKSQIAPGYWFVAPYNYKNNPLHDIKWNPCEQGPVIYDNEGDLVWSGACKFSNKVVFDFKVSEYWNEDGVALTGVMSHSNFPEHDVGAGWFLDSSYNVNHSVIIEHDADKIDQHEFNTFAHGRRALIARSHRMRSSGRELGINGDIWARYNGFREIDTMTGDVLFEWVVNDHVSLVETTYALGHKAFDGPSWDPFHINSIDKNADGDYLISLRHCDALMLISGKNGAIKWRAGGFMSNFVLEKGLIWSRQHHARFIESKKDYSIISIMDNAYSGSPGKQKPTNKNSRGLVIKLNHPKGNPKDITMVKKFDRPDGTWNIKRGSVQFLPNDNVFVTWTDGGALTEFSADGTPLMDAKWLNHNRFGTYRGYKFNNWVGRPTDRPKMVAITTGSEDVYTTTMYVSWNGATEVAMYDFYEQSKGNNTENTLIGRVKRSGFETPFVTQGRTGRVRVEALDRNGTVLRKSHWVETEVPDGWSADAATHPDLEKEVQTWRVHRYIDAAKNNPYYTCAVVLNVVLGAIVLTGLLRGNRRPLAGWTQRWRSASSDGYEAVPKEMI